MTQLGLFRDPRDPPLSEARDRLFRELDEGTVCPCCDRFAKRYRRKLTSTMALALILIERYFARADSDEWLHVENYFKRLASVPMAIRGDFTKLRFWGFIQAKEEIRDDLSPRNGYWRITDAGRAFVRNTARRVPSHVFIYGGHPEGLDSSKLVSIRDALGSRFSYAELMGLQ